MADNVNISEGTGKVIAADDIGGGVLVQRVKPMFGADGSAVDVSTANPLPISDAGGSLTVDGPLTDTQLRATAVPVSIAASVGVTGPLTDTQLRATPVPISDGSGSITVDGAVTVSGTVTASGPLTDTQLRATAVPVADGGSTLSIDDGAGSITVDGTVTANPSVIAMTTVTNTTSTAGDNTIIAAPSAGTRIVIYSLQIQLEAATATTVLKKSGSTTIGRLYCAAAGDGAIWVYPAGRELRLGTAEAFVLNLSGANAIGYTVRYATEAV